MAVKLVYYMCALHMTMTTSQAEVRTATQKLYKLKSLWQYSITYWLCLCFFKVVGQTLSVRTVLQ